MKKQIIAAILAIGFTYGTALAQDNGPTKDLNQWVKDARQAGMADEQIRKNALGAGWPESAVVEALHVKPEAKADLANSGTEPAKNNPTDPPAPTAAKVLPSSSEPPATDGAGGVPAPAKTGAPAAGTAPTAEGGAKAPAADRGVPDDYEIGAGDVLHISVWHEPDATVASAVVRPDGRISMPLLKEVSVLGLTPTQLEKQITEQLTKFLTAPDVTVIVSGISSKKIYLVGAVKKEGPIPFTYRMSVFQALSEAGGLTDYAKRKKIYVLRHENGRDFKLAFDYDAALKGERLELNIPLMAGDTIVVPH